MGRWKKLICHIWPSADALPGELVNRLVLLLMKMSSSERQGLKGLEQSVGIGSK
jgi:hypothetical protein